MSEKREVLKVLESDLRSKVSAIRERHRPKLEASAESVEACKSRIKDRVVFAIQKAIKPLGGNIGKEDRLQISFDNDWGDVQVDSRKIPELLELQAHGEILEKCKDGEIAALSKRAESIRRRIVLHGVDAEVLKMLESL